MIEDKNLDAILMRRDIPEPATNLAHRITSAAIQDKKKEGASITLINQFLRLLILPKPAYVTSFLLLLGVAIGFYTNDTLNTNQDWFAFLETQEEDWL